MPGQTDPYAISLVKSCRAFFILNALFALADRRVTIIRFFLLMAQLTATRILGPSIPTQATGYGSSEGRMALPYHKDDPNTDYKLMFVDVSTEFLDLHSSESSKRVLSVVVHLGTCTWRALHLLLMSI